jgi:hypothetical protein
MPSIHGNTSQVNVTPQEIEDAHKILDAAGAAEGTLDERVQWLRDTAYILAYECNCTGDESCPVCQAHARLIYRS